MNEKNSELINYRKKYQNKWVALDKKNNNVIASDVELKKLIKKADKKCKNYILEKVLPLNYVLVPLSQV